MMAIPVVLKAGPQLVSAPHADLQTAEDGRTRFGLSGVFEALLGLKHLISYLNVLSDEVYATVALCLKKPNHAIHDDSSGS
jgi:hypothetical protein